MFLGWGVAGCWLLVGSCWLLVWQGMQASQGMGFLVLEEVIR